MATSDISTAPARRNQIGQRIGTKGQRTRQRLIDVTVELLETHGMRDLTVAEIAKVAATSPATFYVYFDSVQAVVLGALELAPHSTDDLLGKLRVPWSNGAADALDFVTLYTDLWNRHGTIFRVRNMAAEEGDQRFLDARSRVAMPMLIAIADRVRAGQVAGTITANLHPESTAGVIIAMLERLSSVGPTQATSMTYGITYEYMREAAAHMLWQMLGGSGAGH
jgi:AcrR family transcriptional regulator